MNNKIVWTGESKFHDNKFLVWGFQFNLTTKGCPILKTLRSLTKRPLARGWAKNWLIKYKTTLIQRGVMIIHPLEYLLLWTYVKTAKNRWLRLWIQRSCKSTETFSHFLTGHFEQDVESLGSKVNMFLATILCYVRNWIWSLWCSCRDGGGSIGEEELGKVMRTFGWDPKEEELKVPHPLPLHILHCC